MRFRMEVAEQIPDLRKIETVDVVASFHELKVVVIISF
jgi:hypothetical protein